MNFDSDFRYVTPKGLLEFVGPEEFKRVLNEHNETQLVTQAGGAHATTRDFVNACSGSTNTPMTSKLEDIGYTERKKAFTRGSPFAKLIADTRCLVGKVGKWMFVHGGITPKLASTYSINEMNAAVRKWLKKEETEEQKRIVDTILFGDDDDLSPIWNRTFSSEDEWKDSSFFEEALREINNNNNLEEKAGGMVMGHTPQYYHDKGINSGCNYSLWRVDVGMSKAFGPVDSDERQVQVLVLRPREPLYEIIT